MTDAAKWYWLRKPGTAGLPGQKNGLLAGRNRRKQSFWTVKPSCALVFAGGEKLDAHLAANPDREAVEVVLKGTKTYHGRTVDNWVPADAG